jgi:DnaJ-domain-containing protein 1
MTAFERSLHAAAGPMEPTTYILGQLPLMVVQELAEALKDISPLTLKDHLRKERFSAMLHSAMVFLRWKEARRRRERDEWIPPEFAARHRASSGNSFEFSAKKHFALLEVPLAATREDVLKAWRRLSRQYHPDTPEGDEEKMKLVNLAKEYIFRIRGWDRHQRKNKRDKNEK